MRRRSGLLTPCAIACLALLGGTAQAAAPAARPLSALEMAVTYAHGSLQVYEIAAAGAGGEVSLPLAAGATNLRVTGGSYQLSPRRTVVRIQSANGQVSVRYAIPTASNRDFLFVWHTEAPISRVLMLTGPSVHPSGLGMSPFSLGGRVQVGGQALVSFSAKNLPAGFTERWLLELGQPGGWIANILAGLGVVLPLLFIALAIRGAARSGGRRAA